MLSGFFLLAQGAVFAQTAREVLDMHLDAIGGGKDKAPPRNLRIKSILHISYWGVASRDVTINMDVYHRVGELFNFTIHQEDQNAEGSEIKILRTKEGSRTKGNDQGLSDGLGGGVGGAEKGNASSNEGGRSPIFDLVTAYLPSYKYLHAGFSAPLYDWQDNAEDMRLEPKKKKIRGEKCFVIRFSKRGGELLAYISTESYFLLRIKEDLSDQTDAQEQFILRTIDFKDFREIKGRVYPFIQETQTLLPGAPREITAEYRVSAMNSDLSSITQKQFNIDFF